MRTRKPTNGRVPGIKFDVSEKNEENDLKKAKAQTLKQIAEQEKNKNQWYDEEMDKNLKKQ